MNIIALITFDFLSILSDLRGVSIAGKNNATFGGKMQQAAYQIWLEVVAAL